MRDREKETHIICCHTKIKINYKEKFAVYKKHVARAVGKPKKTVIVLICLPTTFLHKPTDSLPNPTRERSSPTLYLYYRFAFLILKGMNFSKKN